MKVIIALLILGAALATPSLSEEPTANLSQENTNSGSQQTCQSQPSGCQHVLNQMASLAAAWYENSLSGSMHILGLDAQMIFVLHPLVAEACNAHELFGSGVHVTSHDVHDGTHEVFVDGHGVHDGQHDDAVQDAGSARSGRLLKNDRQLEEFEEWAPTSRVLTADGDRCSANLPEFAALSQKLIQEAANCDEHAAVQDVAEMVRMAQRIENDCPV